MQPEMLLYGVFFIIPSILFLLFPNAFLKYGSKWSYKTEEPSDEAVIFGRIASGFGILIGLILTVIGFIG